jgi:glutaredoxin 3
MAKVEIYTKDYCPYCDKAKNLFAIKGVKDVIEYDITRDAEQQQAMMTRAPGARTVPQIFINDQRIGGCDDLYALEDAGKLTELLNV